MEAKSIEKSALEKKFNLPITIISVLIPIVVAVLFVVKLQDFGINVEPMHFLPPIYAAINGLTALLLVAALLAIKNKKRKLHQALTTSAIACSLIFLVLYVVYHMTTPRTEFGGDGITKTIYLFILATHIILSITIIPLVLISYVRALAGDFENHKKMTRFAFPLWLYVAVTGVVVYLMISPYYVS